MRKTILFSFICLQFLLSCGQEPDTTQRKFTSTEKTFSYHLGDSLVHLQVLQYGNRRDIVMLNLHDDETTSVDAARAVLEETGGMLIRLDNRNNRFIEFSIHGKPYRFDPNRMFSVAGIRSNLGKLSKADPKAVEAIRQFGIYVLTKVPVTTPTLIALHNNDEGRLTIDSYRPGSDYGPDAAQLTVQVSVDPDNFLFTTDSRLYRQLKDSFNIVQQHNGRVSDDGSLSVFYGRMKRSYVNVETEYGQVDEQVRMLRAVVTTIFKVR